MPQGINIDILGKRRFLQKADRLITRLRECGISVETCEQQERDKDFIEDEGVITVQLQEPKDGVIGGLFFVTDQVQNGNPIVNRFQLTTKSSSMLGLTFSINHPEFDNAISGELKKLVGDF